MREIKGTWMLKGFYGNGNCARYQGCICQISLGWVEVLAIEVDDRANA